MLTEHADTTWSGRPFQIETILFLKLLVESHAITFSSTTTTTTTTTLNSGQGNPLSPYHKN